MSKHELYEVFKDNFDPKEPWRVQMKNGVYPCRLKREAKLVAETLKKSEKKA